MTNQQFYLAIGVPLVFNAALIGLLMAWTNAKFAALDAKFEGRFSVLEGRLASIEQLWRAELHRVDEILDARLKHLEERN